MSNQVCEAKLWDWELVLSLELQVHIDTLD